jgi:hypothetical protein
MTIQETVVQVRAKYTNDPTKGPTEDECAAIVNEVAWIHRNDPERWGVSGKTSGSYGTVSGTRIAVDIVQERNTLLHYDVLAAAGWDPAINQYGPATPTWQPKGVLADPSRPWLAPTDPGTPPPDPPPPTGDLEARVADLETRVLRIETKMQQAGAVLSSV